MKSNFKCVWATPSILPTQTPLTMQGILDQTTSLKLPEPQMIINQHGQTLYLGMCGTQPNFMSYHMLLELQEMQEKLM
ncbi:hypothetical protein I79_015026 [Cricetulus griseus]|uniref:Uncharacterized protein n=1 Tax=Cricetulus griseus TaxID=10029 RepID=G3HVN6_CRIGR|nr:hypothetical protein I79_015026 [Cricetulus griseus]